MRKSYSWVAGATESGSPSRLWASKAAALQTGREEYRKCALSAEEIDQKFRDAGRFFVLEPVSGICKRVQFGVGAEA
jgi:hypothetical protein